MRCELVVLSSVEGYIVGHTELVFLFLFSLLFCIALLLLLLQIIN